MTDLLLNNDNDLDLSLGRLSLVKREEVLTAQRLGIKFKTYEGEWYLDTTKGVPYFQRILKRGDNSKVIADTVFKSIINNDPSIVSLDSFESEVSRDGVYSFEFKATTEQGDIFKVSDRINF